MKKVILGIVIIIIIVFAYEYQKPVMTSVAITSNAMKCLNHPPKTLGIKPFNLTLSDIQSEHTSIEAKSGFLSNLTNQRELSVKMKFKGGVEPTVKMNAYSGKCIGVTGPLN